MIRALNLGCGQQVRKSDNTIRWDNVDIRDLPGVTVMDMTQIPWRLGDHDLRTGEGGVIADETYDFVLADNVLEHFDNHDFIAILNELDRVVKVGGRVEIIVPHAFSQGAYQDPTHRMYFVPRSCLYWNQVQTPYGGLAVGITANLVPSQEPEVYGNEAERFIRFRLTKRDK